MGTCQTKEAVETPPTTARENATPNENHKPAAPADPHPAEKAQEKAPTVTSELQTTTPLSNAAPLEDSARMAFGGEILAPISFEPGTPEGNRRRFASYASGASTPNTSAGNLSWDGESDMDLDDGSGGGSASENRKSGNPKTLKHSGSAIGLDDMRKEGAGLTSKVVHIEVPFGKPIEEVYDGVHDGPVLGSGVSGLVRLAKHKATGVKYAVKCLDLGLVGTKEGLAQLREEIFIMCQLDHPNIVRLEEVYESHSEIYLVQELCLGGELFDRLDEQPDYHYTESECARLVKQMLSAVRYLHSKGIIHRDLKLENFLFSSTSQDSELKMIDFGLSKHFRFGEVHHEAVGTPYTVSPEVISGSYDEKCDIWAIGVITFLLLSGDPPFGGCGGPEPLLTVRSNILRGHFAFEPEDVWSLVSGRAKEFITDLLVTDPKKRPTARDAQKHAWLREWASRQRKHNDNVLNPNVVKALVAFKEFSDMRKLLCEVLSFTLLPDQIKELRGEFEKMDTDGSGEISLAALKQVLLTNAGAGSLGALKEDEVEDIFNAMRVNKTETRIHWHEFIAAGLSQCQVDDRNLRLAFDRLDSDHKGYITLDDIMDLVGNDELHSEEMMREMWKDSMKSVNCTQARITYDNFLLLMKGQTKELPEMQTPKRLSGHGPNLLAVPEGTQVNVAEEGEQITPEAQTPTIGSHIDQGNTILERKSDDELSMHSLPNMGAKDLNESSNSSIGMTISGHEANSPAVYKSVAELPQAEPDTPGLSLDEEEEQKHVASVNRSIGRRRSYSLTDKEGDEPPKEDRNAPQFQADSRRAVALPEHDSQMDDSLAKNKSALAVNRQLYRAHRQMRLSVMEASRRFEEQQARRARDTLIAQKAGLVMRHGHKVQVTSDAIRKYLEQSKAEQQVLVEKANRRGGRGRASRKKTISDMSGMLVGSMGQDELGEISKKASKTPDHQRSVFNASLQQLDMPSLLEGSDTAAAGLQPRPHKAAAPVPAMDVRLVDVVDSVVTRGATVPGQFRKTEDPFGTDGMYGGSRINSRTVNEIRNLKPRNDS